jgi:hypothetical protein
MHSITYSFAYHVDSTTLADGDYELILGQGEESTEELGNAVEGLTEAPNQSSDNFDPTAPNPTQEGKPRHNPLFSYTAIYIYLYISMH